MNALLHQSPPDLAGYSNLAKAFPSKSALATAEPRFRLAIVGAGMALFFNYREVLADLWMGNSLLARNR